MYSPIVNAKLNTLNAKLDLIFDVVCNKRVLIGKAYDYNKLKQIYDSLN